MRIVLICLIFGSAHTSFAFSEGMGMPRALGLTQAGLWSASANTASLAGVENMCYGMCSARPYLLSGVNVNSFAAAFPIKTLAVLGAAYASEGITDFHSSSLSLQMAKDFAGKVRFGMSLNYLQTALGSDYGRSHGLTFDLGLQVSAYRALTLGLALSNPTGTKRGSRYPERYPSLISTGFDYRFSNKLCFVAACTKSLSRPAQMHAGCEYQPNPQFRFRTGVEGGQGLFYFGVGWKVKQWQLDLLSRMHPQLGQSPMFSLTYSHVRKVPVPICVD